MKSRRSLARGERKPAGAISPRREKLRRETARRFAQRAAAVGIVSFAGAFCFAKLARVDGVYREESIALLLLVLSIVCLIAWSVAFVIAHVRRSRPPRGFPVAPLPRRAPRRVGVKSASLTP